MHFLVCCNLNSTAFIFLNDLERECAHQTSEDSIISIQLWDVRQEAHGHRLEGILRPGTEPVDGAAVDKGWELTQPCSEHFSNRAVGETLNDLLTAS